MPLLRGLKRKYQRDSRPGQNERLNPHASIERIETFLTMKDQVRAGGGLNPHASIERIETQFLHFVRLYRCRV